MIPLLDDILHDETIPSEEGAALLHNPSLNKSTAFTPEERRARHLRGLLPPRIRTLDDQVKNIMRNLAHKSTDLERYVYLMGLHERNHNLFYRVALEHMDEILPLIYTPTVGQACQEYSHLFSAGRGIFISEEDRGDIAGVLSNWPENDIRVIVVTDGERILGLGDLGANGMGIPVGKLALYTACAGIHPRHCLPVTIDVGTNNEMLLNDPLYIGLPKRRTRGAAYDSLIDEFVAAVKVRYPRALIQFEDFGNQNAFRFLEHYRHQSRMFNDDIQGTAAVTLAGLYSALRITGNRLADQKILFFGAGEAGIGIGHLIVAAMQAEGLTESDARARCWFVDSKGLVVAGRDDLAEHKRPFAHPYAFLPHFELAVEALRPTVIIGAAGTPRTFTESIVRKLAQYNERPIIFALSNPTSKSECTAEEAYGWTEGRAVFASGSPFPAVQLNGRTIEPGQANNSYIFPGVGLGVVATEARHVTDEMFFVAARTLADQVSEGDLERGRIYPPLASIRQVSAAIAGAVADVAYQRNLADAPRPDDLSAHIQSLMYVPGY